MKAMILYDSTFGNTELVAKAIAEGVGEGSKAVRVGQQSPEEARSMDLLVLGSPVLGGRPSKIMQDFLKALTNPVAPKRRFATFDTRIATKFAQRFGYAAVRMSEQLKTAGHGLAAEPMGFIVAGKKGPLAEGELERAKAWGRSLASS